MEPVIMALQEDYGREVAFVIVDVQEREGQELAAGFGVRNIPHTIILDREQEVLLNQAGFKAEEALRPLLEKLLE